MKTCPHCGKFLRKVPQQNPATSEQSVGTPRDFLDAVEARFGKMAVDLAASSENAVCAFYITKETDSLAVRWPVEAGNLWLNPEFSQAKEFARKCFGTFMADRSANIFLLLPLTSTKYANRYIHNTARVYALSPRMTFVGHDSVYPKDLMLAVYSNKYIPGFETWEWK